MTHIYVGKLTIMVSDNGLSPEWRQAVIWTNARILLIGPLGTNFSEILIEMQTLSWFQLSEIVCIIIGIYCNVKDNPDDESCVLTHWGRVTHICVSELIIIGSDNGLSPERRQAIIWTSARILLIGPLGTNFSEILMQTLSLKKMRLKMSSAKCCSFRLGLNVIIKPGIYRSPRVGD